jgi:hypothetical protein
LPISTFYPLKLVFSFFIFLRYSSSRSLFWAFSSWAILCFSVWISSPLLLISAYLCLISISNILFFFLNSSIFWESIFHLFLSYSILIQFLHGYSLTGSGGLRIFKSYYFSALETSMFFDLLLLLLRDSCSISFFLAFTSSCSSIKERAISLISVLYTLSISSTLALALMILLISSLNYLLILFPLGIYSSYYRSVYYSSMTSMLLVCL